MKPYALSLALLTCIFYVSGLTASEKDPTSELATEFRSDVIQIREEHLSPNFWINPSSHHLLKNKNEIEQLNRDAFTKDKNLINLASYPLKLTREEIKTRIQSVSKPPRSKRVYENNLEVSQRDYKAYSHALNLDGLAKITNSRFGLVVNRTNMRTYPTNDRIFKKIPSDLDRFQETALFPTDMVIILHESKDHRWYFVQSYNYLAWVQKKDIALGDREVVFKYKNTTDKLVITGDKIQTNYNPKVPEVSELQLEMGTQIPLSNSDSHNIHGQNPYTSYSVVMPLRKANGELKFENALIARSRDVKVGILPYTESTIIKQAFKFLGERYGWGHSYNGRDCSGFTSEVYKSVGIQLPRNSGQQAGTTIGNSIDFNSESTHEERMVAINHLEVGDLIFIPGHVMLFLGRSNDMPYIIHDVTGLSYFDKNGDYYTGILNGVSVTPLLPLQLSPTKTYVDSIYSIKKFN